MSTNQAILANDSFVENCGTDTNQGAVADSAAVEHCHMADRDVVSNGERHASVRVKNSAVLNICALADCDWLGIVASHSDTKPH